VLPDGGETRAQRLDLAGEVGAGARYDRFDGAQRMLLSRMRTVMDKASSSGLERLAAEGTEPHAPAPRRAITAISPSASPAMVAGSIADHQSIGWA
jgi:hypothetical protein